MHRSYAVRRPAVAISIALTLMCAARTLALWVPSEDESVPTPSPQLIKRQGEWGAVADLVGDTALWSTIGAVKTNEAWERTEQDAESWKTFLLDEHRSGGEPLMKREISAAAALANKIAIMSATGTFKTSEALSTMEKDEKRWTTVQLDRSGGEQAVEDDERTWTTVLIDGRHSNGDPLEKRDIIPDFPEEVAAATSRTVRAFPNAYLSYENTREGSEEIETESERFATVRVPHAQRDGQLKKRAIPDPDDIAAAFSRAVRASPNAYVASEDARNDVDETEEESDGYSTVPIPPAAQLADVGVVN